MIRVKWLCNRELLEGAEELLGQWQQQDQQKRGLIWIDVSAEDDGQEEQLLLSLGCHPLAIQDALRTRHPPKLEDFDNSTFILYRGFGQFDSELQVKHVQLAFFVGADYLISRRNGLSFGVEKLWNDNDQLLKVLRTPAMLFTRIVNVSLYGYLNHMVELEDNISQMEDEMLRAPTDTLMQNLVQYRSRLRKLNRIFSYHEKVFGVNLKRSTPVFDMNDSELFHATQDVYEKSERLKSLSGLFYEQCGDLIEGYLSLSSHRLNQTMQVLTVITAIFVPLSFLAGLYGMNFEYIPELHLRNGYFYLVGTMGLIATSLLWLFRRKNWL